MQGPVDRLRSHLGDINIYSPGPKDTCCLTSALAGTQAEGSMLPYIGSLVFLLLSCAGSLSYRTHCHPGHYGALQFKQGLCLDNERMGRMSSLSS